MLNLISVYKLFLIPIITIASSQTFKLIIEAVRGNFSLKNINKYGGMPSSHTAFVISLATVIWHTKGLNSAAFAISFALAALIIRDAIGLRRYLSNQGKMINLLIKKLPDGQKIDLPRIEERLGHTLSQVISGFIFGFVVSVVLLKLL